MNYFVGIDIGGTYWNQSACCNGNIIFYVQPGVSVRINSKAGIKTAFTSCSQR